MSDSYRAWISLQNDNYSNFKIWWSVLECAECAYHNCEIGSLLLHLNETIHFLKEMDLHGTYVTLFVYIAEIIIYHDMYKNYFFLFW